jgi:hypothetical protein
VLQEDSFFIVFLVVLKRRSLPESWPCRVPASLPRAALGKVAFVESCTRQSPTLGNELVYRVQDTQHRKTLGKDTFAECQTLGKGGSRQRAVSDRSKADGRQSLPRAEVGTR